MAQQRMKFDKFHIFSLYGKKKKNFVQVILTKFPTHMASSSQQPQLKFYLPLTCGKGHHLNYKNEKGSLSDFDLLPPHSSSIIGSYLGKKCWD